MRRLLRDELDVVGDDVTRERVARARERARARVEHERVGEREHDAIGDDLPLLGEQQRAAAVARRQPPDVVRQHPLQEIAAIGTDDPQARAERQVDERGVFTQRRVLTRRIVVRGGDAPAVDVDTCAVQRRGAERALSHATAYNAASGVLNSRAG